MLHVSDVEFPWLSTCHMLVFAHLGLSPRAAGLLMAISSVNPAVSSLPEMYFNFMSARGRS